MWNMNTELAPRRGLMLCYLSGELLFEPYELVDGRLVFSGSDAYADACPMECHLFDAEREYRVVRRSSVGDVVERVLTRSQEEAMDPDLVYVEDQLVRDEYAARPQVPRHIRVVSRYAYTPDDTLCLTGYRICVPEGEGA